MQFYNTRSVFSIFAAIFFLTSPLAAHDSWVVASKNAINPGQSIRAAFLSAHVFVVSEQPTEPNRVAEWVVVHGNQRQLIDSYAVDNLDVAAEITLDEPGMHVIAVALHPNFIELKPDNFNEYLRDEKAMAALAARRVRKELEQPGTELYAKYAKTFIQVGDVSTDTTYQQPVGHPLEIIPLTNPCQWNVGDEVAVRVLRNGKPAIGLRVSAGCEGLGGHEYLSHAITGDDGVVRVKLARSGLCFIRTHTIYSIRHRKTRADQTDSNTTQDALKADWESLWASITFRVAESSLMTGGDNDVRSPDSD